MSTPRSLRWFRELVAALQTRANAVASEVHDDELRIKMLPLLQVQDAPFWPAGAGWYVDVAQVGPDGALSIWLDRYLDKDGDHHLGVWYSGTASEANAVADLLRVPPERRYKWRHRNADGMLAAAHARQELRFMHEWIADAYSSAEAYVGMYVRASPHLLPVQDAVDRVWRAMHQLARAASRSTSKPREDAPPQVTNRLRYWELVQRLARPEQRQFRQELLDRFQGRCIVSGYDVALALDAAHIRAVKDFGNDGFDNGLLLRADLHRLFDAGAITVFGGKAPHVRIADDLRSTPYRVLDEQTLNVDLSRQTANLAHRNRFWTPRGLSNGYWDEIRSEVSCAGAGSPPPAPHATESSSSTVLRAGGV